MIKNLQANLRIYIRFDGAHLFLFNFKNDGFENVRSCLRRLLFSGGIWEGYKCPLLDSHHAPQLVKAAFTVVHDKILLKSLFNVQRAGTDLFLSLIHI